MSFSPFPAYVPPPLPVRPMWVFALLALLVLVAASAWIGWQVPAAPWLLERQRDVLAWQAASPWLFGSGFFVAFVAFATFTLPGCSLLCLAAGLCFGVFSGTAIVAAASTVGAALSFLAARHTLRDWATRRFGRQLGSVQATMARDGALVLLSLRLAPVVPFSVLNPLMGLTQMPLARFAVVSFFGMLPGSAAYVIAGTELSHWAAGGSLASPALWAALIVLALLPWVARTVWRRFVAT